MATILDKSKPYLKEYSKRGPERSRFLISLSLATDLGVEYNLLAG
jgi:hypothetical protein